MQSIDWFVLLSTLIIIVVYGTLKTKGAKTAREYIQAGNNAKWWTIGLSVMATQASAITFLSTPGQAFNDGLGFVQFYFGIPIAIIIVCVVFIPIYHKLKVYTAYEFLESRFDLKTRSLTASLFLIQRSLSAGITIFAPAIILSSVLGWDLLTLNIIIGGLVIIYTVSGGTKAVNYTQKYQMGIIIIGLIIVLFTILNLLPENINFKNAVKIASLNSKMDVLNFSFDLENRYTIWSGLIGGTFLMLSYFGTDQSQVQRYLSGKSLKEMQLGMIFNGIFKIPMQFFILFIGVMVFVFYQFNSSPLNFNPQAEKIVLESKYEESYIKLKDKLEVNFNKRNIIINDFIENEDISAREKINHLNNEEKDIRNQAKLVIENAAKEKNIKIESNDKDYVFINFILENLPKGLVGLLLAVILSAAMSSTSSEINALATTTSIDIIKRNFKTVNDQNIVYYTKLFTLFWGICSIGVACVAFLADNLIQLVNIIGSIFYGNVLGIFLIAFFMKKIKSNAVFTAAVITQIIILIAWWGTWMPYLWLNVFGCALVILISGVIQLFSKKTVKVY
ncbi:MAG: sodium:solute symporter [Flavobacteriaceae bacterium]|nr:sodium:solute symporter [Flavobacteriaceae bacterium]|tara:strand:- start:96896 stop:98581 length:1686 start_codon:yes stop_codon:yes gene_type:complete